MKRKGRNHLPKAGTRPSTEQLLHHERADALHPFSSDPSRRRGGVGYVIVAAVLVAIVLFAIIGLIALD
jgi:hypothetical protein